MARYSLIVLIVIIFVLPLFFHAQNGVYPLIVSMSLLPLAALTYLEGPRIGLVGALACVILLVVHIALKQLGFISVFPIFLAFALTPLAFGVLKDVSSDAKAWLLEDLDRSEKIITILQEKETKLENDLKELDHMVTQITGLYEITKEMSATLLFSEIFKIFSEFLKRNFEFQTCKLILVNQTEGSIEQIYRIQETNSREKTFTLVNPQALDIDILNIISKTKDCVFKEGHVAVPLMSQNRLIGLLHIRGLKDTEIEKFLIVSRQFSLEIEKVRLYETVQKLAITDGLTGVFARRHFMDRFKEEIERSIRFGLKLSLLMVDLDLFKKCNDKFGHLVGDVVLREVANVLKQNMREIDLIGRYGGEEFALFLPDTDRDHAVFVAQRLREFVGSHHYEAYDEKLQITVSIGVSTFPVHVTPLTNNQNADEMVTELIECADKALYEAKSQGRNTVVAYQRN